MILIESYVVCFLVVNLAELTYRRAVFGDIGLTCLALYLFTVTTIRVVTRSSLVG